MGEKLYSRELCLLLDTHIDWKMITLINNDEGLMVLTVMKSSDSRLPIQCVDYSWHFIYWFPKCFYWRALYGEFLPIYFMAICFFFSLLFCFSFLETVYIVFFCHPLFWPAIAFLCSLSLHPVIVLLLVPWGKALICHWFSLLFYHFKNVQHSS